MSDFKFAECQTRKGLDSSELPSYTAQQAKGLNSASCSTSATTAESTFTFAGGGVFGSKALLGGGVMGFGGGGETLATSSATMGCEQTMIIAQRNYDTVQKIKCIMTQTATSISAIAKAVNNIDLESTGGRVVFACPDKFEFLQNININVNNTQNYNENQKADIENTLKETAKFNLQTALSTKTGFGATPQGQDVLAESIKKMDSEDFAQQVKQTVVNITSELEGDQTVKIKAFDDIFITGKECKISQDTVLDIVSQTMVNGVNELAFKDYSEKLNEFEAQIKAESVAEGAPTLAGKWTSIILAIGAVVFLIIIAGGIYYLISKKGDEQPSQSSTLGLSQNSTSQTSSQSSSLPSPETSSTQLLTRFGSNLMDQYQSAQKQFQPTTNKGPAGI
jgi:hypothetical protein